MRMGGGTGGTNQRGRLENKPIHIYQMCSDSAVTGVAGVSSELKVGGGK